MQKIFYDPELMATDKAKMLLAVYSRDGSVTSYLDHHASIVTRIRRLVDEALEDGENASDLIENYLHIATYAESSIALAHQIAASPQMQSLLAQTAQGWAKAESRPTMEKRSFLIEGQEGIKAIDQIGQQHTEDLVEEMTLRHYLEQIAMIDQD
jgi:hypothetical protein